MERKRQTLFLSVFSLLIIAAVLLSVALGVQSSRESYDEEALRTLEDSLRRAAVSCYAIEGCYPPTLEYLTENYGVYIDESRYVVYYDIFASNIVPDITVLERTGDAP